jgi:di/tricarboxylate transporter
LGLTLVGFITQGLHGIDASWLALGGFLILLATGVIDKQGLKGIDWNFLLLFGTLVSLSGVIKVSGLSDQLSTAIGPVLAPLGASPYLFLGAVAVLTLLVRLVIPLQPTVLIMIIALLPVTIQMGYNPFCTAIIVLALSNNWFVPQQNSVYLGVYSASDERSFTHEQARPFALAHAILGVVAVLITVPIWQLMGLVPM